MDGRGIKTDDDGERPHGSPSAIVLPHDRECQLGGTDPIGLNPTPETQKQDTPRFCLSTEPTASDEHGPPAQPSNLPSGAKDTPRRRRHQSHSFGSGPRSSPEAAQRGVEDAGLEVGPEPKDHGTGRPFS